MSLLTVLLNVVRFGVVITTVAPSTGAPAESVTVPTSRHWAPAPSTPAVSRAPSPHAVWRMILIESSREPAVLTRRFRARILWARVRE